MIESFRRKIGLAAMLALGLAQPALADKIKHPKAIFSGLDKITGRIISFEVATDETVQFGSLQITPRICYTRPQTEAPQTTSFIEVDEIDTANQYKRIFSGWVFAASPGLSGIEHPVYDIWLNDCKGGTDVIASAPDAPDEPDIAGNGPVSAGAAAAVKPPAAKPVRKPAGPDQPFAAGPAQPAPAAARPKPTQSFFPTSANPSGVGARPEGGANH